MQSIQELVERALAHIAQAESLAALDQARVQYVGKAGELTAQMKLLGGLAPEERKPFGQAVNTAKKQDRGSDRTAARGVAGNGEACGAGVGRDAARAAAVGRARSSHDGYGGDHEEDPDGAGFFLR